MMSDTVVSSAGIETRQSMIRVWMAISAVWVAFWLLIAAVALATAGGSYSLSETLGSFALIVLLPPVTLLLVGVVGRLMFRAVKVLARPV